MDCFNELMFGPKLPDIDVYESGGRLRSFCLVGQGINCGTPTARRQLGRDKYEVYSKWKTIYQEAALSL